MPVNTSNPLYQNIQSTAEEVKNLYTNQPTFMNTMQNGVVNNDATLNSNVNDYSSAVDQLFSHDKTIANANLSDPMFSQGNTGYVADPMAREKLSADTFALEGSRVATSLNRLEKRKIFLAGLVDKAVKMYETGVEGKEFEYKQAQADFDNAMKEKELKLRETEIGLGKTEKERTKNEAKDNMIQELKNGATLTDVIDSYKDSLSAAEIKEIYDSNSLYGKMKEESSKFNRMYQSAKKGVSSMDTFAALPATQYKTVMENTETTVIANKMLNTLASKMGDKAPTFWKALSNNDVGALKRLTAPYRNDFELAAMVDSFEAGVRQQVYGSAFTATEAELAKQWLASGNEQANQIWAKLIGQSKMAKDKLYTQLKQKGYTEEEIDDNLRQAGYQDILSNGGDWQ